MYLTQVCRATENAGAPTGTPLTEMVCPWAPILIPSLGRSGKFGTPWARMHLENASVGLVETEPLRAEALVVVVLGLPEPPPHPATRTALASATATTRARREQISRFEFRMLSRWSASVWHRFYRVRGFKTVSPAATVGQCASRRLI